MGALRDKLQTIAQELRDAAPKVAKQVAEAARKREECDRQWELDQLRYEREQEAKRRAEALQDSKDELAEIITGWTRAQQVEEFFLDAQRRASQQESSQSAQIIAASQGTRAGRRDRCLGALSGMACTRLPIEQYLYVSCKCCVEKQMKPSTFITCRAECIRLRP